MRRLESLLLVAELLSFVALVAGLAGGISWLRFLAPVVGLVAVAHVVFEGPRWQMVPAYLLAAVLLLISLGQFGSPTRTPMSRSVVGVAVGLGVVGLGIAAMLAMVLPVFGFSPPSGPYRVGTVTYHWIDTGRHEVFSADPTKRRELMVQVWYPTTSNSSSRAAYVDHAGSLSPTLARVAHWPGFTFDHLRYVTTNAIPSAPIANTQPSYPVLLFLEGLNGYRQMNTFQVEELVSHGYVVVGLDQPYAAGSVAFPSGHTVTGLTKDQMNPYTQQSLDPSRTPPILNDKPMNAGIISFLAGDVSFVLDQLTALNLHDPLGVLSGRLDLDRVGTFGISLGAIVAGEACHLDPRLKACLMMDAAMTADVVAAGLAQPSMWITRDAGTIRLERRRSGGWTEADIHQTLTTMRAVYDMNRTGDAYYVQIPGMFHVNFTDTPSFSPLAARIGMTGPIDAGRGHDIVNAYTVAFFDRHLKGSAVTLLDGPSRAYPDAIFETTLAKAVP